MAIAGYSAAAALSAQQAPGPELGIILVLVALYVALHVIRNARGMRFSTSTLYRLPLVYLALTAIELLAIGPTYLDAIAVAAAVVAGAVVGLHASGGVHFFEKRGRVHYRRSPVIMIIWLLSFIGRFWVEIAYPAVPVAALAVDMVLAGTTGLIIGEAFHIKRGYESYRKRMGTPEQ